MGSEIAVDDDDAIEGVKSRLIRHGKRPTNQIRSSGGNDDVCLPSREMHRGKLP